MTDNLARRITDAVRSAAASGGPAAIAMALASVRPDELEDFFHDRLDVDCDVDPLTIGLPASPGAVSGRIVLSADDAIAAGTDEQVILVRPETSPDDVLGMQASSGILTSRGGMASHAAVVARGWGIPAVVGAGEVDIDGDLVSIGAHALRAGDEITIDGGTGAVYAGALRTRGSTPPPELETLLRWADQVASGHVQVRANADTCGDATLARSLGAQGIGLCRTEHMFLAADRLELMRRFILSDDPDTEREALEALEAAQITDFETVLEAMDTLPVTVRLLDPPLHEFLPDPADLIRREALDELDDNGRRELAALRRLHEANPMIGTRGVRLGIVRTGVYEMQVRALCTAAANLIERGRRPVVEIMIPLVVDATELRIARGWVTGVLDEIGHPELGSGAVTIGAMIETPRAALTAAELAVHADFFSFGTNDLTQMTYAFSRDDVESKLLPAYQAQGILPANPFAVLDQAGVGELVRIGCVGARSTDPAIKLGACGEHAGHPDSAAFMVQLGLDSVSCSPFRVPLARLGVAQALLKCARVRIDDISFDVEIESPTDTLAPQQSHTASVETAPVAPPVDGIGEALVVHVLKVRGFVTPDGFVESLGVIPTATLDALVAAGHVRHIEARDMYGLLPSGKQMHQQLLADLTNDKIRRGLAEHYPAFLELNDDFKQLCTDWQIRNGQPNDHADAEYDAHCARRLIDLCAGSHGVLDGFADALPRMARYTDRLDAAAACVIAGQQQQFTGVMCGSFHDIWMELHEDLIVLQGIDRTAEGSF